MLSIENVEYSGFQSAMRGMRNPKNSWSRNDTVGDSIGENDLDLASRLAKGGSVHAKYRRMMIVTLDITAPLYWWKEFDTYKVGTVANSTSTMHKIHAKEFEPIDFSTDYLSQESMACLNTTIAFLNDARWHYNDLDAEIKIETDSDIRHDLTEKRKFWWEQMIQLLPSSYNQKRTVLLNYEVLCNMYHSRRNHKLREWRTFCKWVETLPYFEQLIKVKGDIDGSEA